MKGVNVEVKRIIAFMKMACGNDPQNGQRNSAAAITIVLDMMKISIQGLFVNVLKVNLLVL